MSPYQQLQAIREECKAVAEATDFLEVDRLAKHVADLAAIVQGQMVEEPAVSVSKLRHPVQPLYRDQHGVIRFKENAIVKFLLEWTTVRGMGLNELAGKGFSNEDFEQFAQLIGYSLSGFGELSYVSDETFDLAEAQPMCDPRS